MSRGRTDVLRVNLPAQQDTSHRDTGDAQRMYLLMLAREKAQQTSSHNHCPCAKCQVNKGFLFYTSKYLYFSALQLHPLLPKRKCFVVIA